MPLIKTLTKDGECPVFIYQDKNILVKINSFELPIIADFDRCMSSSLISSWFFETQYSYIAASLKTDASIPTGFELIPLRNVFANNISYAPTATRGVALLNWCANEQFCCHCGNKLINSTTETAKICPNCGQIVYPHLVPAVIVLIKKDDKILLARHKKRISNMFACISGFMEAGESAESCVEREVFEETGLNVKNIQYRATQSWPFPNQLMIGFTADWESGTITIQEDELLEAKWFSLNNLPTIPPAGSIAYKLIKGIY
jgi:NAD+ diphosphatase